MAERGNKSSVDVVQCLQWLDSWPQNSAFMNEKLVVQVLGIGERVGADIAMKCGEEETYGVMLKREEITKAISLVIDSGNEGKERRERAMKLQVLANKAFENKGSSCLNVKRPIKDTSQISGTKD
ncbi:anthocyanidin 3-O-glucosyltransferase 4 [Gossypium hirsutum]|uniref:Anthocyanidin 3-O-glucosyltransferase 4 n=1 Tax=Gossypium hirsutum TaxID=3635 RepID=A0A1U8MIF0_GOSHI|nr:anthocyanidin 3-O-glucosyltransferase 4-like [Gossypium hirsutum]